MNRFLSSLEAVCIETGALLLAMLLFGFFLLFSGSDPLAVYEDIYRGSFGSSFSWQNSLARSAPLMLTALCTALPARLGMIIIGNEGALLLGALAAAGVPMLLSGAPPSVVIPLALLAGAIAGGLWIAISGALRQLRGVNETISSLLLFYIGLALFLYLVEGPMRDPSSLNKPATYPVGEANMLGNLPGMDVHVGFLFGIVACALSFVLMQRSTFGFAARVAGGNPRAAKIAGLPIGFLVLTTCALGGGAAGLAGAVEVMAVHETANAALYAGLGFAGILVAFVARQHPLGIIPVAILLGGIEASGGLLQRRHDLPDATVDVFKGILFMAILAAETLFGRFAIFRPRSAPQATTTPQAPDLAAEPTPSAATSAGTTGQPGE